MVISSIHSKYWKGSQVQLKELIKSEVQHWREHDGCIWSIRFPGHPLFVAHMDTVFGCKDDKPLRFKNGKIRRKNSALGADDRAGVNLIMNHYNNVNWCFTRDEEIGRKGANSLATQKDFLLDLAKVNCIIQLDCTGHKVVRAAKHG